MSERQETTPLQTRAEKVRAFLRQPNTLALMFAGGFAGNIAVITSLYPLADTLAASGDPNTAFKTGLIVGFGVAFSTASAGIATFLKDALSEDNEVAVDAKKSIMRIGIPLSLVMGSVAGGTGYLAGHDAFTMATLPTIDAGTIVQPEKIVKTPAVTAFDMACEGYKKDWQEVKGMDGVAYRVNCSPK